MARALTAGALGTGNCCVSKRSDSRGLEAPKDMSFFPETLLGAAGKWVRSQPHAWYESRQLGPWEL